MSEENKFYNEAGKHFSGENPDSAEQYSELRDIWNLAGNYRYAETAGNDEAWAKFKSDLPAETVSPVRISWFRRNYIAVAASVALLMVAGIGAWMSQRASADLTPAIAYTTGANEFKTLELPDGSKINMNANSRVEIMEGFSQNSRNVELTGEALFEVAPDKNLPFVVKASNTQTRVLGTGFDIQAYSNEDVTIQVTHGKVAFGNTVSQVTLVKGESARCNLQGGVSKTDNPGVAAWQNGEWVLKRSSVDEIAVMFKHRFGKELVYSEADGKRVFTGSFAAATPAEEIVSTISEALKIKLSIGQ